jgi:hypothetical protein
MNHLRTEKSKPFQFSLLAALLLTPALSGILLLHLKHLDTLLLWDMCFVVVVIAMQALKISVLTTLLTAPAASGYLLLHIMDLRFMLPIDGVLAGAAFLSIRQEDDLVRRVVFFFGYACGGMFLLIMSSGRPNFMH